MPAPESIASSPPRERDPSRLFRTALPLTADARDGSPLQVVVADEYPLVRLGLRVCVDDTPELEIVGEARDGAELRWEVRRRKPRLVVMDGEIYRRAGAGLLVDLFRESPGLRVLLASMQQDLRYLTQLIKDGVHGLISKKASPAEWLSAMKEVGRGRTYFSEKLAQDYLGALVKGGRSSQGPGTLSPRECEVLALIASGLGNKQIGARLNVGARTVETHRERIMRKLDIHSVAGLTRYAIAQGLVAL